MTPPPATRADAPPDPGNLYLQAFRELERREAEVLRLVATIQKAAKDLERWQAVHVVHAGAGFPKEVTMIGRSIDAAAWPTGREVAETLAAWHEAAEVARTMWACLPVESRASVPAPS